MNIRSYVFNDDVLVCDLVDVINNCVIIKNNGYTTSNCIKKGKKNDIFLKELNMNKFNKLYKGDYFNLLIEYYTILKKIIKVNELIGIVEINEKIFEFSKIINSDKFLDDQNSFEWSDILKLYHTLLDEINLLLKYSYKNDIIIGVETAIWNFTIDGFLFDFDPPKILKAKENSTFSRKGDVDHLKRTLYRSFSEIGMKSNLLLTLILGQEHGSFVIKNKPNNYLEILLKITQYSFTCDYYLDMFMDFYINGVPEKYHFVKHPISQLRQRLIPEKKLEKKLSYPITY